MRHLRGLYVLLPLVVLFVASTLRVCGCTSAVVGAGATCDGRTLLWKHRDSGHPDNFVGRVEATDSTMAYVALFNAGDTDMKEAWIGFNSAGFAVMNTASYNLAPDTAKVKDREGLIMSMALRRCRTVADFEQLLQSEIGKGALGVQANFGVTDAGGNGAYFETSDHSFRVFTLDEAPGGMMIRSNYSYSGGEKGRLGEVRHDNAEWLAGEHCRNAGLKPETFTEHLSRSFYHHGRREDMSGKGFKVLTDRGEYIPRRSSCASVVIEGAHSGENPAAGTMMWVAIGFPAASHVEAVTLDSIPPCLLPSAQGGRSELCNEVNRRRSKVFPRKGREGKWLIDMEYLKKIMPVQHDISEMKYEEGRKRRNKIVNRK